MRTPTSILMAVLWMLASTAALAGPPRLSLVIGNNGTQTPDLETLSFADDDAVRTGELMRILGFDVTVLTELDSDSLRLLDADGVSGTATRANVLASLKSLIEEARRLASIGQRPVIYLAFAGHGSYDAEGRGFLHLADGRLTLRDLIHELVIPTQELCDVVIVLDSCNAEFLVKSRGAAVRRQAGTTTLRLEEYRHVGLVLSSSATGEVREWGRFLGGVFSHQLRSALMGGADQDCDGLITFPELAAFLEAANQGVTNPELRLKPYVRAPLGNPGLVVAAPSEALNATRLFLDTPRPLRLTLLDPNLARRADLHLNGKCPESLLLPGGQTYTLAVSSGDAAGSVPPRSVEFTANAQPGAQLRLSGLPLSSSEMLATRGTDQYYRQHLFEVAYGAQYFAEYVAGPYQESLVLDRSFEAPWYSNPWGWVAIGTGLAATTMATIFTVAANDAGANARHATWAEDIQRYNQQVDRYNLASGVSWAAAGAALLTGTLIFVLDSRWDTQRVVPEFDGPIVVRPNELGVMLEFKY